MRSHKGGGVTDVMEAREFSKDSTRELPESLHCPDRGKISFDRDSSQVAYCLSGITDWCLPEPKLDPVSTRSYFIKECEYMRVVPCTVRFSGRQNKQHSVRVEAVTLYEAAYRAWSKFKVNDETFEESYETEE
jgi:hypothetical protein